MFINLKKFLTLALSVPGAALCNTTLEIYCFTSGEINPIRFEMRYYTDKNLPLNYAFVKYQKSKIWIPLVSLKSTSTLLDHARQEEITSSWLEISNNKPTGLYEMMSQGTTISLMRYTNFSIRKAHNFIHDTGIAFSEEKGCIWK
ncbi:hypothetical protein [Azohydromonas lata]|uniref:hypothetical protein n=1 Tax=Azohydromonas lata TaxID=45677 RepID=UPI0012F4E212|nr:hypothetical protein [Azohydromonas lata]